MENLDQTGIFEKYVRFLLLKTKRSVAVVQTG